MEQDKGRAAPWVGISFPFLGGKGSKGSKGKPRKKARAAPTEADKQATHDKIMRMIGAANLVIYTRVDSEAISTEEEAEIISSTLADMFPANPIVDIGADATGPLILCMALFAWGERVWTALRDQWAIYKSGGPRPGTQAAQEVYEAYREQRTMENEGIAQQSAASYYGGAGGSGFGNLDTGPLPDLPGNGGGARVYPSPANVGSNGHSAPGANPSGVTLAELAVTDQEAMDAMRAAMRLD